VTPEEAQVTREQHVDIGDEDHHVAVGVTVGREQLDAGSELRGIGDQVRDRAGADLGEVVELGVERGHERLVRADRHLAVEQRARLRRPQHHGVRERTRAADMIDVRVREHEPAYRPIQPLNGVRERLPLRADHQVDDGDPSRVVDDHAR
jgi:hypothetical protein